jgi:L,D-transpeptidase ErfK/SrfK
MDGHPRSITGLLALLLRSSPRWGSAVCLRRCIVRRAVFVIALLSASAGVAQPPQAMVGGTFAHTVARGETWQTLGSRFGIEPALVAALNGRPVGRPPTIGERLQIDNRHLVPLTPHAGIVINVPQRMLFLKAGGQVVASYPVALGRRSWPTFVGPFTIVAAETDPVWDVPPSIQEELRRAGKKVLTRVGPGPSNPLGKYWLGLSEPNFGIHGTIAPSSIYRFETHGCIRLHPDDIADLWPRVGVGTAGEIIYEPVLLGIMPDGSIVLEAHGDVYKRGTGDEDTARARAHALGVEAAIDWRQAGAVIAARDGMPHVVSVTPRE